MGNRGPLFLGIIVVLAPALGSGAASQAGGIVAGSGHEPSAAHPVALSNGVRAALAAARAVAAPSRDVPITRVKHESIDGKPALVVTIEYGGKLRREDLRQLRHAGWYATHRDKQVYFCHFPLVERGNDCFELSSSPVPGI